MGSPHSLRSSFGTMRTSYANAESRGGALVHNTSLCCIILYSTYLIDYRCRVSKRLCTVYQVLALSEVMICYNTHLLYPC